MFFKHLIFTVTGIGLISGVANANLLTNGDFETGDLTGWEQSCLPGGVEVIDVGGAYGHVAHLDDPTSFGYEAMWQDFYVPEGVTELNISFDYLFTGTDTSWLYDDGAEATFSFLTDMREESAFIPFIGVVTWTHEHWEDIQLGQISSSSSGYGTIAHFNISIDVSDIFDYNPNASIQFNLYEMAAFFCVDNTDSELFIDNVTVAPVPEPGTILLLGAGLAGIAGIKRRKK